METSTGIPKLSKLLQKACDVHHHDNNTLSHLPHNPNF